MLERFRTIKAFCIKYANVIFFVGGFIFDSLTLVRIDSTLDLLLQGVYLIIVVGFIFLKTRFDLGLWHPHGKWEGWWEYESEAIHFFYGGLLSAYVIFYFKSTTLSRSVFFLGLVVVLMFANEMPQLRRAGHKMRLGLYAFCLVSFLNYLLPVLIGRMGALIFAAGWILATALTVLLVSKIAKLYADPRRARRQLGWAPATVLVLVALLYWLKLIPPVPLSLQYAGIYQNVSREGDRFRLTYEKQPWYLFWRHDDRHFRARPGDQIHCFTRVFAPRRFTHHIYLNWEKKDARTNQWKPWDRIPLAISGGRDQGFRGYAIKSNYEPGQWRVDVETEDGRALGGVRFDVEADPSTGERQWKNRWM